MRGGKAAVGRAVFAQRNGKSSFAVAFQICGHKARICFRITWTMGEEQKCLQKGEGEFGGVLDLLGAPNRPRVWEWITLTIEEGRETE